MSRIRLAVATAFALLVGAATLVAGAAGMVGPKTGAGRMRAWSVQYMNGPAPVTVDEAVATAASFNVIVGLPKVYRSYVSQMKAANPDLQLFVYAKGAFTYDTNLPEVAYSHDAQGRRIHSVDFGTWLLNPAAPEALANQVIRAKDALASSGYDGIFLDTLGPAALNPSFVSALPINPATKQVWTPVEWVIATAKLAGQVAAAVGAPVIGNGLRDGRNYFEKDTSELLKTGMAGAMAEAWLRGGANPLTSYPRETVWKQNVDAVVDAGLRGASFLAVTKAWSPGTQAEKDAWHKYAVASFLLANDGRAYLTFSYAQGDATVDSVWNHVNLGVSSGAYAKVDGVYQRSFARGRVLVNPTPGTFTVSLGATYHTLDGKSVTSVTLAPNTAEILTT